MIGSSHNINNLFHAPKVHVGDIPIKRVKERKVVGVYTDEFLSWNEHIEVISKKTGIGAVRKLKPHVNHNPRANGAKRRSGRKPGARVTNRA